MKDFKSFLDNFTKVATNVRLRDRSVKIIQYGCQMLVGYYGLGMNDELVSGLRTTRRITSTARKAFWLLKSINHIGSMNTMIRSPNEFLGSIVGKLDFIEQFFLVLYYIFENQIFLSRCQLFNIKEDEVDLKCNVSWFMGDLAFFCSTGLKLFENIMKKKELNAKLLEIENSKEIVTDYDEISSQIQLDLKGYNDKSYRIQLSFVIASLEIGVSMHYVCIWRALRGEAGCIRDGNVGLMGVVSSALIIYEGYLNILLTN
mmetsp:Transcript_29836/g.28532  ORF Transcript_29836/g.28532 Transcript_29836/m.28532 type:complete len:259 (-) Transcript_29836:1300-2076(-)